MKYSEEKLEKAMAMKFERSNHDEYYVKAQSDKESYKYKLRVNHITKTPLCQCWWFTNRAQRHAKKYGLCSHQLGYLWKFDKPKFWEQVSIREEIKEK